MPASSTAVAPAPSAELLDGLRRRIARALPESPTLPTELAALDALLPGGGVPRGRLTELLGARGSGKATLARALVRATVARGGRVAYVDAARTLAPRDWARVRGDAARHGGADGGGLWVVRPREARKGAWCADVLLRSAAFALVVLDGAPPLPRGVAVRLTRLARDAGAAFVVLGGDDGPASLLAGALRLRTERGRAAAGARERRAWREAWARAAPSGASAAPAPNARTRRMVITVEKGGRRGTVEVMYAVGVAHRVCTHPEVPDRRGVARAGSRGRGGSGAGAARAPLGGGAGAGAPVPAAADAPRVLPRKRRCAEPALAQRQRTEPAIAQRQRERVVG